MLNTWPRLQSGKAAPTGPCFSAHPVAACARELVAAPLTLSKVSELTAAARATLRRTRLDMLMVGLPPVGQGGDRVTRASMAVNVASTLLLRAMRSHRQTLGPVGEYG